MNTLRFEKVCYSNSTSKQFRDKRGISRIELIVVIFLIVIIIALSIPAILSSRESARSATCAGHLRNLGIALHQYHETYQSFPPAAIWHPGGFLSMMLNQNRRIDLITHENWAQLLLPQLGRIDLAEKIHPSHSVGSDENKELRTTSLAEMRCPSDSYNHKDNHYRFELDPDLPPQVEFARGNYAINGGTQCHRPQIGTSSHPAGEGVEIIADDEKRIFQYVGSGIAGVNRAFSLKDFTNGQSTLVAIEEVRAGIHTLDPRGVWALGQIGGSITSAHGISGDAGGPNNQWDRADDLLGCGKLHATIGSETLTEAKMPCTHYIDRNDQATARSMHKDGVNVLFVDGAVRFIHDRVDRGLWHVMHARDTPSEILAENFDQRLNNLQPPPDEIAKTLFNQASTLKPGDTFENSLKMNFVVLPPGEFQMGIPDIGNNSPAPPESPSHPVQITNSLWMGQYEVTQETFKSVMGNNPSFHQAAQGETQPENYPVEQVTWYDAEQFCQRLSNLPKEREAKRRYRLPTEAEWEYACRAGQSTPYNWSTAKQKYLQSGENAGIGPIPVKQVGTYPPNQFGLYDMRGNVWEWCADWFDRTYYSRSPIENPQGPQTGHLKVLRGSDWIYIGEVCRINYPILPPWKSNRYLGFRVVCEMVP